MFQNALESLDITDDMREALRDLAVDMEEIIKQAVYLQGAYDRERMLK